MKRAALVAAMAAVVLGLPGCAAMSLNRDEPQGTPVNVKLEDVPVKGFDVIVERHDADDLTGELLAVQPEGLWLLTREGTRWVGAPEVEKVIVRVYSNQGWVTLAWTVAGGLSTISHGFFLIVTAPAWAAVGGTVTAIEFSKGKVRAVPREGLRLHEFARFPAGMPPGWHDAPRPPPPEPMVPDWAPER